MSFSKVFGSSVVIDTRNSHLVHVRLGALDHPSPLRLQAHDYGESKARWHLVVNGLPQFACELWRVLAVAMHGQWGEA